MPGEGEERMPDGCIAGARHFRLSYVKYGDEQFNDLVLVMGSIFSVRLNTDEYSWYNYVAYIHCFFPFLSFSLSLYPFPSLCVLSFLLTPILSLSLSLPFPFPPPLSPSTFLSFDFRFILHSRIPDERWRLHRSLASDPSRCLR